MRLLFYCASLSRSAGGLHEAVAGLANALCDAGVDVAVAGGADRHFEEDKQAWGAVRTIPYPLGPRQYGFAREGLAALRRERPDLVHVHGIWGAPSIYGRAATLSAVPTVVSPHGMLDPWILARRAPIKRIHAALFERPLLRRAWAHALNDAECAAIAAFMPSVKARIFVVPNGVAEPADRPSGRSRSGALFLGRLHPKKQVAELVAAWRALALPRDELLTIAGWGDPEYEAAVRRAADGADNIAIVGPLYGEAKAAALAEARWFILPSVSEGLPMAVLEAIQRGCIPILTPECNLPELARDGIALPMRSDFGDFASVMARARGLSAAELERRSSSAADYARNYAWPAIADAMIGHYQACLEANSAVAKGGFRSEM